MAQPAAYPRRVVLLVHERAPQHRDADGAEHGVPGPDLPPRRAYADGPAVPHDHALHRGAGAQLAAQRHEPARHGRGQLAGSPHRHGEPVGLREHGHDEAERPRTGRVQRDVGVPRAPADQQPRVVPGEAAPARPEGGRQELADRAQGAVARQRQTGPGTAAHRREGAQQQVEQPGADGVPLPAQVQPGLAVPGVRGLHAGGRVVAVAVHQGPPAGQRVAQRGRGCGPPQPVGSQVQPVDHGGGRGEGVEGAEGVLDEAGVQLVVVTHRAADRLRGLEDQDRPPGVREEVRGDQAVGPGADHHGVDGGGQLGGHASHRHGRGQGLQPTSADLSRRSVARPGRPGAAATRRCASPASRDVAGAAPGAPARGWRPPRS